MFSPEGRQQARCPAGTSLTPADDGVARLLCEGGE